MPMDFGGDDGGGAVQFIPPSAPAKSGGPFIHGGLSGGGLLSAVSSPVRAALGAVEQLGKLSLAAGKALAWDLPGAAAKELWHDVRHPDFSHPFDLGMPTNGAGIVDLSPDNLERYSQTRPFTGPFIGSDVRSAQDVEQVARAGGNRLLPGVPFGEGVGQLGSGPGLLGNTAFAKAAQRGGGGVLSKLLEDAANASFVTAPVSKVLGAAASDAAAQAATHAAALSEAQAAAKAAGKEAADAVMAAAKRAEQARTAAQEAGTAAATGDPAAGAAFVQQSQLARAADESLRQAQAYAAQVAEHSNTTLSGLQDMAARAQARAEQLQGHADVAKLVHNLGSKAASSPFGTPALIGRGAIDKVLGPAAEKLVGTELGQRHIQPLIARAGEVAATLAEHAAESRLVRGALEDFRSNRANESAQLRRGFEDTSRPTNVEGPPRRSLLHPIRGKATVIEDADAQAVAILGQSEEGVQLAQLLVNFPRDEALRIFDEAYTHDGVHQYTPEQLELAADVYGPERATNPRAVALRDEIIGQVREQYAKRGGALEHQNLRYERLAGETEPIMAGRRGAPGEGAFGQVEHNLRGTGPSIEHLDQWHRALANYERLKRAKTKVAERALRKLAKAAERFEGQGLTAAEIANPRALFERIMGPARQVARDVTADRALLEQLAADESTGRLSTVAQRVLAGKLAPAKAETAIAGELIRLAGKRSELHPLAQELVDRANAAGMGTVPRGMPSVASATAPAQRLGAAEARAKIGGALFERGSRAIAAGQAVLDRAAERLGMANRAPSARQLAAVKRLADAGSRLRDLQDRIGEAIDSGTGEVVGTTAKDAEAEVVRLRTAAKRWHRDQAAAETERLHDEGVPSVNPTPPPHTAYTYAKNRGGNARAGRRIAVQVPDWALGAWSFAEGVFQEMDPKFKAWATRNGFFNKLSPNPEELLEAWGSGAGYSRVASEDAFNEAAAARAGQYNSGARTIENWYERVHGIYEHTIAARGSVHAGDYLGDEHALGAAIDANYPAHPVASAILRAVLQGTPAEAAAKLVPVLERAARLERGAEGATLREQVARAIKADQYAAVQGTPSTAGRDALDVQGQALYDRQVLKEQARIQGGIVAQREGQLGRAPSPGRAQGRAEGALLGTAQERIAQGTKLVDTGAALEQGAKPTIAQGPALQQETVIRAGSPLARIFARAGAAERDLARASAEYARETRALDRLDSRLAATRDELMRSIDAQPRPMRPVMEAGRRIRAVLIPEADRLDVAVGPGAGDVYRAAAAEATVTADHLRRAGIDPQYIPGLGSGEGPRLRTGGAQQIPTARATAQRRAGRGLFHETTYRGLFEAANRELTQELVNQTVQGINDAVGGPLIGTADAPGQLERRTGMTADELGQLSNPELVQLMREQHLHAWDPKGRLVPDGQVTGETLAIPSHVWRKYSSYEQRHFRGYKLDEHGKVVDTGLGGRFLHQYDKWQDRWKTSVLYLTGRWHTSQIIGDAVMAMAGGGIRPDEYFRFWAVAKRLDRLRRGVGTAKDRAFVEARLTPRQAEALALAPGHVTPGAVVDRGFTREEFGAGELQPGQHGILHPIQAGWRLQSYLDNMNRTTVWLAKLDQGLDARGLADFREAYPNFAGLSDAEIQAKAAVMLSIRTMGDYTNLSAFERDIVKRIIPFYSFQRHITKLAFNLAIHDPVRVVWMLHLPSMFAPDQSDVDWLAWSYNLGGDRQYTPPRWNPFDSATQWADPNNPFAAVSPLLTVPAALISGFDPKTMKRISRPPGSPEGGVLGIPGAAAYMIGNQIPQLKAARESIPALFGHEAVARYGTGQPYLPGGRTIPSNQQQLPGTHIGLPGALAPWMPLIGLGTQRTVDEQAILDAQARKDDAMRRAAARYAKLRSAAG